MDSTDKEPMAPKSTEPQMTIAWKTTLDDGMLPVKMPSDNTTEMSIKQVKKESAYIDSLPSQFSGSMIKKFPLMSGGSKTFSEGQTVYCARIGEYVQIKKKETGGEGKEAKVESLKCKVVKVAAEGEGGGTQGL